MTDQQERRTSGSGFPSVAGRCPACHSDSLFLASGGHVTCARRDCRNPGLADDLLHGERDNRVRFFLAAAMDTMQGWSDIDWVLDHLEAELRPKQPTGDSAADDPDCARCNDGGRVPQADLLDRELEGALRAECGDYPCPSCSTPKQPLSDGDDR